MKKTIILLFLTSISTFAHTFTVNLSLQAHTSSNYGQWKLQYVSPEKLDDIYRTNIIYSKGRSAPYQIEHTGIEIFHKQLYLKEFLQHGYYNLEWIPRKGTIGDEMWNVSQRTKKILKESEFFQNYHNQDGWEQTDWSMLLADYINHTIGTLPTYELNITNNSKNRVKILGFYAKTIFTSGGEASPGGAYFPTKSKINYFPWHWNHKKVLHLKKTIILEGKQSKQIPLSIFVKKGAQGDGPGKLTVGLYVKYIENRKKREELLTIISQSEDYGYQTGW
jgi:hypothetical protein